MNRKLSRRRRSALLSSVQTPEIHIDELKDESLKDESSVKDESEDGYASDSTSDSASEELDYADTEDTTSGQPSPPTHGTTCHTLRA